MAETQTINRNRTLNEYKLKVTPDGKKGTSSNMFMTPKKMKSALSRVRLLPNFDIM